MEATKKTIGILGGMGPEATADIFTKIVKLTPAEKDSDHIHILIDNNPMIPSRVEALLHNGQSPVQELIKMAKMLENSGADFLIMPCNTASYYTKDIQKHITIPILNIVEETSRYIINKFPNHKKIGLLGTEMTLRLGLYQKSLLENKVELLCKDHHCKIVEEIQYTIEKYRRVLGLNINEQEEIKIKNNQKETDRLDIISPYWLSLKNFVMRAIYGKHGIKAGKKYLPKKLLLKAINELVKEGVKIVILGCTELPLVLNEKKILNTILIDPTEILAKSAIEKALQKNIFDIN